MTRPVRTLVFSTLYPSSVRPTHGIFVETRLRELLKSGQVETRVVAPVPWFWSTHSRWGDYARYAQTPQHEVRHGVDVWHPRYVLFPKVGMTSAPLLMALASIGLFRRIIAEGFDFDAIDAHYYYPDGVAAALLARWLGKPLTITARGTDLNLIPQYAAPRQMMQWAAGQADASIGVCAALVDVLKSWNLDPAKLHVMRNGVDLVRFHPMPQAEVRRALSLDGAPLLLSVGHLIERKGHHVVVAAMPAVLAAHPGARLLVIGEGEERVRLQTQIDALGLGERVRLTGALPNEQLAQWYSAADALVLASSREGWANVLLESMACGTPVVATRIWGTPEVVTPASGGELFDQRAPGPLADAVLRLLCAAPDRRQVRRYAEMFGWGPTSDAQIDLFRQLTGLQKG